MESNVLQKRWVQGSNVVVDDLRGTAFTGEAGAHTFQISGVDSAQETVAITGTITGRFLTATNVTVPLTGSVSDGVASLTLTEDCYVIPGRFVLSVYATNGSTTQCIYCAVGNVFRTQSDIIEYPSASIPDIEQIIADAQAAVTEINADVAAAQAAVAAAQTAVDGIEAQRQTMIESIASVAGQGTDTTLSQSGVAADAKAAGDQISDLKSAMKSSVANEQLYGASDALLYGNRNSIARNGVTFTFNSDGSCTVDSDGGAATATSYVDYFSSSNSFPDWIIPGVTYDLDYSAENVYFRVITYTNGVVDSDNLVNKTTSGSFVVPDGKSGIIIRLAVPKNRIVNNETVNPHLFVGIKNADIEEGLSTALKVKTGAYTGSSINNIAENSVYICDGNQVANLPNSTHTFVVETIFTSANNSTGQQTAFDFANGDLYWRKRVGGDWGLWVENNGNIMVYKGILPSGNLNDITYNSIYLLSNGNVYTNSPGTQGTLYTLFISNNIQTQIFIDFNTGKYYYRIKSGSAGTWKSWINANDPYGLSIGTKYVAFGDSLTWGAVWDMDQTTPYYRAATKYQIPTRIANAIGMIDDYENLGIGGAGYYAAPSGNVSVTNAILAYDFTNVELVTIMSGVNDKADSSHPLGSADNPAEGTICGAVKQIIDFFADNYPRVQIVFIQPTPSGHLSDPWAGRLAAGWSMNDFDEEVGKLCHNEHVGYVNWWESVFCKQWDDFSGGYSKNPTSGIVSGPNYSHPTTEKDYAMIGDFIAGKVATLFRGRN